MSTPAPVPRFAVPERLDPAALSSVDPKAAILDLAGETMGTRWSVRLALPSDRDDGGGLAGVVQKRLDGIVAEMSHWQPESLLSRYNASAPGSWTALPQDFARVIACALDVAERSAGAFDPAIGRLTDLWGLGPTRRPAPSDAQIAATLAHTGWRKLAFDPETARLRQPGGLWLDLSGIAKGHAADAVADALRAEGIRHALVEVGGEFAGRGMRPDGDPWWVELEAPPGFDLPPLRVALHQLAVATSGDYPRGAHTLDPKTGKPAVHATTSVSVVHDSCMAADAWASALSVLAPREARALAAREKLAARLIDRAGGEWLSPAFQQML
ncbi:MAG TPA: FAD:protein FMN transferase [Novosphingobium sp.]|nr:FAD:protein FMN transferase [Novosphingobium sp.]